MFLIYFFRISNKLFVYKFIFNQGRTDSITERIVNRISGPSGFNMSDPSNHRAENAMGGNFLEHASPHDYKRGGSAISHMEQVILKFREHKQTPSVYLFTSGLGPEISAVIYKLNYLGLVESGNVFFVILVV
jgi:hypothetical protein